MTAAHIPAGIDADRLGRWIADRFGVTEVQYRALSVGRSNLTFQLLVDGEPCWVLRRPPLGHKGGSAHNVMREGRIMHALGPTDVPTVNVLDLVDDPEVLEVPFVFMDYCAGHSLNEPADLERIPREDRHAAGLRMMDVLARIHKVDIDEVGLGDLRRPGTLTERQLRRWLGQFNEMTTREIPEIQRVHDMLVEQAPPEAVTGLVHGDYKPNNLIWSDAGEIRAVVDWELSLTGEVEADLGYVMAMLNSKETLRSAWVPQVSDGFPTREEMIAHYESIAGFQAHNVAYFEAFALWKFACIREGVYTRLLRGQMGDLDVDVEGAGRGVDTLAQEAEAILLANR
ncbi:phosphotransferase family protein [Brevibacterium sp. 50QC2O2]|uniref:phosphotransferase family protein n=1 Tax=Brevibacterium TaxID=1696 RepID=UPI00211CB538|nr:MULTISPECIES: phosphotransferase family protein [unclassified Brevibacterium]MCQ9369499.1 phosphotransferase family protein [Brevibacterium sp. 91QC2O2]MCQ9386701.1 phosphotransferase family protein [Brevibacterium sp. 68QC2CO]MCQ9389345.1 phosphotransferase family protein [Brevibacterium sp. 50QC2O2]